ncbi:hypothetical protein FRC09_019214 [Ceratobasidium sp. 395]|nr:hypothetical protein FRC09_019214 [Ceratobasidium sp. 395]
MVLGPLQGHNNTVYSVAYSPDGCRIASGSWDKTIQVWDTATGAKAIPELQGHKSYIHSVTFSYDGRLIISGSSDKTIRLWDVRTGRSAGKPIRVGVYVSSVAVSPEGSKIVGGGSSGALKTYDAAAGTMLFDHIGHTDWVRSVAFLPDGRRIASGSHDNTVRIWDALTGSGIGEPLEAHTGGVMSVAFSPDGRRIASSSYDNTIGLWDTATGVQTELLQGHTSRVLAVAFTPDGSTLVSGSYDQTIVLWDMLGTGMRGGGNGNITLSSIQDDYPKTPPSPSPSVSSVGIELLLFDEITSTTTPEQIVLLLGARDCANLTNQIDLTTCSAHPISFGGFGDIYRCKLKDDMDVAIKTIRLYVDSSEQSQKHLKYAARELYTWSKCRHPNVQQLLGLVMFRDQIGMVAVWESNGDMPRYLQRNPDTDRCRMVRFGHSTLV